MNDALKTVKSGQITFAIRDTMIDNLTIKKDDYMGIEEGSIVVSNRDLNVTAKELLNKMLDEDSEILTIIKGEEATEEQTKALIQFVEEKFPEVEIEIHDGKQPLYQFIFSVE